MSIGSILGGIGAVASGVSGIAGLFGSGSKNKGMGPEEALNFGYNSKMYEIHALVDAAKKYGFHPLALLGNGGFQPGPMGMPDGGGSPWMAGDAIGQALGGIGSYLEQDADRADRRRERDDIERERRYQRSRDTLLDRKEYDAQKMNNELVKAQIEEVRSRTMINNARLRELGAAGATTPSTLRDALGIEYSPPKGRSTAADMQNQYGDIVENIYGIGNWLQDMWGAKSPSWWPDRIGSQGRPAPRIGRGPQPPY